MIVLDGLPYRVVERAIGLGAFAGWPEPARLVAPFPSMTNMSLTLLLSPLGVEAAPGYELQHYDWDVNAVHGGSAFEHHDGEFPWRTHVDVANRTLTGKFGTYARPRHHYWRDLAHARREVLDGRLETVIAHVGATDALQHLRGDEGTVPLVLALDEWLRDLRKRHAHERGRPLRVVLLSDHGNSNVKIRRLFAARKLLREAGLRVRKRLEAPGDVVVGTFGVTGYAALYVDPAHAEIAARALTAHAGVDLAAWRTGPLELRVVSDEDEAFVCWTDAPDAAEPRYGYERVRGDPLWLDEAVGRLRAGGALDASGLATGDAWLRATVDGRYPDAPRRLVEGLTGRHVANHASVLVSLEPGWAWGWKSAAVFAWLRGGALEGTHGGLDHDSSVGFLLASDPALLPGPVVRPDTALAGCLAPAAPGRAPDLPPDGAAAH